MARDFIILSYKKQKFLSQFKKIKKNTLMKEKHYIVIHPDGNVSYSTKIYYNFIERNEIFLYMMQAIRILYFTNPIFTITVMFIIFI